MVSIKYGLHTLQFAKGMNAIKAANLKAVPTVLNKVKQAVAAGELDAAIATATTKREKKSNAK